MHFTIAPNTTYNLTLLTAPEDTEIPLIPTLFFFAIITLMLYGAYLIISMLMAAVWGLFLATPLGQALQVRFDRLQGWKAPIVAYFQHMAHLLAVRRFRPFNPPPGFEDDVFVALVWCVPILGAWVLFVLLPLALLAWGIRKVSGFLRSMVTSLRQPKADSDMGPFRFLDLPPELRNKIYAYATDAAFADSIQVAYKSPRASRFDLERKTPQELILNLLQLSDQAWNRHPTRRLALLATNRQIHNEVARLSYQSIVLDFSFCDLPSSLPQLTSLVDTFQDKLQFVRKLELPLSIANTLLFAIVKNDETHTASLPAPRDPLSTTSSHLLDVTQVTVYPDPKGATLLEDIWDLADRQAVGLHVIYQLADSRVRMGLRSAFPDLVDIVVRNRFGSERFRRTEGEGRLWEFWYSGAVIPRERRRWVDVQMAMPGELFDVKTRLTGERALGWVRG
ncbi:hypothetical protein PRZ48_012894 [Zasmidium cellare]|uniref:F-box domain-containing protein n=1 Tax=Zasmidium cellare TaxID=395010 RepID=A0ABR0E342_ZASCE|nr:hypothetical protein PRZ48_012894 [Zasmidium cellare]